MTDLEMALVLMAISIFLFIIAYKSRRVESSRKKIKRHHILTATGIALMAFGLYELPWGAMEIYKLTEEIFNLSLIENYILWTIISVSCITFGYLLYRRGRK